MPTVTCSVGYNSNCTWVRQMTSLTEHIVRFSQFRDAPIPKPRDGIMEIGEAIKNPAYRIFQTEYSGCLDISAHA